MADIVAARDKGARRNDIIAILLIALVALAPIPLGSNRPTLWAISDTAVFAVFFTQALMRYFGDDGRARRFMPADRALLITFIVIVVWHIVQILPIGPLLPAPGVSNAAIGSTISLVPGQTVLLLMNFLAYGAVFALAYEVAQRPSRAERMLTLAAYLVGLYALYGLYNFAAQHNALLGLPRQFYIGDAAGTFINRNSFATFLGLGLILNVGLASEALLGAQARGDRPNLTNVFLHTIIAAVIMASLLATHSRMGLFSSIAGAFVTFSFYLFASGISRGLRAAGIGAALVGIAALAVLYGQGVFERLGSSQDSFDIRNELYAQVWELITTRPFWGFGAGNFEAAFPLVHHLPVSPDLVWDKAHNTYLTALAELGVIVGVLPTLLVVLLSVKAWRGTRVDGLSRRAGTIMLGCTTLVGLHSLIDFSLEIHAVALLYAFLLGTSAAAAKTTQGK